MAGTVMTTGAIRIVGSSGRTSSGITDSVLDLCLGWVNDLESEKAKASQGALVGLSSNAKVVVPSAIPAAWLGRIETRIRQSQGPVVVDGSFGHANSATLSRVIASRALAYFQAVSDLLPSEPHLSRSARGELVAEHGKAFGNLTTIVAGDVLIVFASVSGEVFQEQFAVDIGFDVVRELLGKVKTKIDHTNGKAMETRGKWFSWHR